MEELYWIIVIGNITASVSILLIIAMAIAFFAGLFSIIEGLDNEGEKNITVEKVAKCCVVISVFLALLLCFLPSKKDLLLIYGCGSVIDCVQSSDAAKEIPDNSVKAINEWLKEMQSNDD